MGRHKGGQHACGDQAEQPARQQDAQEARHGLEAVAALSFEAFGKELRMISKVNQRAEAEEVGYQETNQEADRAQLIVLIQVQGFQCHLFH